jgi:hypothetical protein
MTCEQSIVRAPLDAGLYDSEAFRVSEFMKFQG